MRTLRQPSHFLLPVRFFETEIKIQGCLFPGFDILRQRLQHAPSGGGLQSVPSFQMKPNFPFSSTAMSKKLTYFSLIVDAPKTEFFFVFIINNLADDRISGLKIA